ncbi:MULTISPECIES: type II secretion system protein [unclassified Curtobacterium]|uniref:type II secretion system protein n=1 Tax=unclassified Curtobacterium TaxID=257496 RepID=UPI0039AECCDE
MYAALMGKLNARRKGLLEENDKGFTLIELLVVVIIIGILAAIAIPIYIGVQNNAKDSSVQNDVSNLKTAVVAQQTNSGAYPAKFTALNGTTATPSSFPSPAATWTDAGATLGTNTKSLSYGPSATGFCIIGTSTTDKLFYATESRGVSSTACTIS